MNRTQRARRRGSDAERRWVFAGATGTLIGGAALSYATWHRSSGDSDLETPPVEGRPQHRGEKLALTPGSRRTRADVDRTARRASSASPPLSASERFSAAEVPITPVETASDAGLAEATPQVDPAPLDHPALDDPAPLDDPAQTPSLPPDHPPVAVEAAGPPQSLPRQVTLSAFQVLRQPGLCNDPGDAIEARQQFMQRFRHAQWDADSRLFIDPRLPQGIEQTLVAHLDEAERETSAALRANVPRPDVFAYFDTELLLAASCTNDDVVAYYDGALHVVPMHDDVRQSVLHEFTHHVLIRRGFLGPTWAQEGIAMYIARETWWHTPQWLARVADAPFALEDMERAVPYTMRSDQALLFYVQSAAMVTCAVSDEPEGVAGLVRSLYGERRGDELRYELPNLARPSEWNRCRASLQP